MSTASTGRVIDESVGVKSPPPTMTYHFSPHAAPCYFRAVLPKEELDGVMDENWTAALPTIPDHVLKRAAKGFRTWTRERVEKLYGGTVGFHRSAILKHILANAPKHNGREILMWNDVRLDTETVDGKDVYVVEAMLYLEPTVEWKVTPLPTSFKTKLPMVTEEDIDKGVEQRIRESQEKHTILIPVEDTEALPADGQFVVLSCNAAVDGKVYERGSFKNHKVRLDDSLKAEFRDVVKRTAINGTSIWTYNEDGQDVVATVTVHNVYNPSVPAIDDDLAISCGHQSLDAMKATIRRDIEDYIVYQREEMGFTTATMDLLQIAQVSPVPDAWIMTKAREAVNNPKASDGAIQEAAREIASVLVRQLVVRAYGIAQGIEGDKSLSATPDYCQQVRTHILKNLEVEDMETEDEDSSK